MKSINIDYVARTVDGHKAAFTDDEIKWASVTTAYGVVDQEEHTLNRRAGTYTSWARSAVYAEPPPLFQCEKAPPPKF